METETNEMEAAYLASPSEVASTFRYVAQFKGMDNEEWVAGAVLVVECAAFEARYLLDHPSSKAEIWENRRCEPYSLIGAMVIATDDDLNLRIAESILQASENGVTLDPDMVAAARFFIEVWKDYAAETRASYRAVISDALGEMGGTGPLTERFAKRSGKRSAPDSHPLRDSAVWLSMAFTED